jgi:hypothetical protein
MPLAEYCCMFVARMNAHSVVGVLEGCDPLQQYNIAAFFPSVIVQAAVAGNG